MSKWVTGFRLALAALLIAPLLAHAAGLGRLTVQSSLGQPLNAEIEVVSLQPGEDDGLTARLASQEAFRQAGIEMSPALVGVRFTVERRAGRPVIRVSTLQPVNEPFLDLLVELQWATGRLVREYTFLLDPPEYKGAPPIAATPAPEAKPAPAPAVEAVKPPPTVEARPITPAPAPAAPVAAIAPDGTYEVKKGDTLGAIARDNRPAGVTFNQMLIALYRANQSAFIRENINLVRAGRILAIPDRSAIEAVDVAEANRLVQAHHAEFDEYRRQLGAAVGAAPAAPAPREREVAGRITTKPGAPAPAETKDQLKLSRADVAKPGTPASRAAREDDRIARERALKDAQSRTTDLEKNVSDLQKLLEMKNQQLAELEKKAGAKPAAPAAPEAPKPAAEAPKPAAEAPKPAPEAAKAPETPKPAAEAPKPAVVAAKPKPRPAAPPPPPPPSLMDEFLDNPVALGGLGGVVVLLAGYGVWAWRRKKASATKFQDSVLGGGEGGPAAAGVAPGAVAAAGAASTSQASVSQAAVGGLGGEEVDPIAEADVYMAYGRDAQAEEILKEALAKDANRIPVHLKMLEIYASRRDKRGFEQTALKVKNLTNGAGPDWEKAAALGRALDPGSGFYGGSAADATQAIAKGAAAPAIDIDITGGGLHAPTATAPASTAAAVDFDLGATTPGMPRPKNDFTAEGTLIMDKPSRSAEAPALDFNLGDTTTLKTETLPTAAASAPPAGGGSIDFDLNIDISGQRPIAAQAAQAPVDLGAINLDLGAPTPSDPKWQEVATKLDLAKAYEEMGDKDGARELLNEVLKEGDAAQQGQANQMLSKLG